jgi:minor extracellular serine protease Vpr
MMQFVRKLSRATAVFALASVFAAQAATAANLTPVPMTVGPEQVRAAGPVDKRTSNAVQQISSYYIVQLQDPPLALYEGGVAGLSATRPSVLGQERLDLQSDRVRDYGAFLQQRQSEFVNQLQARIPGAQVERRLSVTMNGLVIRHAGQVDLAEQLRSLPGVKQVFENEFHYLHMDASLPLINAPVVWERLGSQDRAGDGIKVAIIDSGIRPEHPMFLSNGHTRPSGLPSDDYCSTVDPSFCNDKLALARFYAPTFPVLPDENISPLDFNGHGTHVAGTAVGNPVTASFNGIELNISGVAPGATLMIYRAFYQTETSSGTSTDVQLIPALEDAVADGAHVINNSWGGGAGGNPANSPYAAVFAAAEAAGVLMVTSAGNSGPGARTVSCPACIESGLAVANTQTGRLFRNVVDAAGVEGIIGEIGIGDFEITAPISGPLMPVFTVSPGNELACDPLPAGSLEGHIALVSRGVCAFTTKANNIQAAGGIAMILWNNQPGPIVMSMPGATLPSVSILLDDGVRILEALEASGGVGTGQISETKAINVAAQVDIMAASSSRGPNGDTSFLKPDVAAPGTDILSAYPPPGGPYNAISGTSMASPHVAGAAALLRQLYPELNAFELKSMLITSANPDVRTENAVDPATPFDRGSGRLDISAAANTAITFDKASAASPGCVLDCAFPRSATSQAAEAVTWNGTVSFTSPDITGSLDAATLELAAGGTVGFTITVDTRYAEPGWHFGEVLWRDASGTYPDARMPIAILAAQTDDEQVVSTTPEASEVVVGEPLNIRSRAGFAGTPVQPYTFTVLMPEGTALVEDSLSATSNLATQFGFSIAPNLGSFAWAGTVNQFAPVASVTPVSFPYAGLSLTAFGSPSLPCEAGCDEVVFELALGGFGFIHNGEPVSVISITENGFITASAPNFQLSFINQNLPDPEVPNNVIAPLWTDLEVGGAAGGAIYYNVLFDGVDNWLILEWNDVYLWGLPDGPRFTFSIWIKVGTDEIYYNYLDIPVQLNFATVGIEDVAGAAGTSAYFNGTGTYPATGEVWQALLQPGDPGFVEFEYDVVAETFGAASDTSASTTRNGSVTVDLSEQFTTSLGDSFSLATVDSPKGEFRAVAPVLIVADGEVGLQIVDEPANGTLSPAEAEFNFVYTPTPGFFGTDSFSFQAVDDGGNVTNVATVNVSVVNRPPVAQASGPLQVRGKAVVTLSAAGSSDPDGDALTYSWAQTGGTPVTLSGGNTATPNFTAPNTDGPLTFRVTVSDGDLSSTASVSVNVKKRSSDTKWYEGSFGTFLALLGLCVAWVRRRSLLA